MKRYYVVSAEYTTYSEDWYSPPEDCRDVVEVEAPDVVSARVIGLRIMREQYPRGWVSHCNCPFTGMEVHETPLWEWEPGWEQAMEQLEAAEAGGGAQA